MRTRSVVRSRAQLLVADAATGALVGFLGNATWSVPPAPNEPDRSPETRLLLQHLSIDRGLSVGSFDPADIADHLEADRMAQKVGALRAVFQSIETGGSPALAAHLYDDFLLGTKEGLVRQVFSRLTGSQVDPDAHQYGDDPRTSIMVGVSGLPGEYGRSVSRAEAGDLPRWHDLPRDPTPVSDGRTVVTFADFRDEPTPGMRTREVQAALAATTSLRARAAPVAGVDNYAVELEGPAHLAAAALMLGVHALREWAPSPSCDPWSPFGWGSLNNGPIDPAARSWERPVRGLSWRDTWGGPLRGLRGIY